MKIYKRKKTRKLRQPQSVSIYLSIYIYMFISIYSVSIYAHTYIYLSIYLSIYVYHIFFNEKNIKNWLFQIDSVSIYVHTYIHTACMQEKRTAVYTYMGGSHEKSHLHVRGLCRWIMLFFYHSICIKLCFDFLRNKQQKYCIKILIWKTYFRNYGPKRSTTTNKKK